MFCTHILTRAGGLGLNHNKKHHYLVALQIVSTSKRRVLAHANASTRGFVVSQTNPVDAATSVVDLTWAEVERAIACDRGQAVHLMITEDRNKHCWQACAIFVHTFNLFPTKTETDSIKRFKLTMIRVLRSPIRPVVVSLGDSQSKRIGQVGCNSANLFPIGIDAFDLFGA